MSTFANLRSAMDSLSKKPCRTLVAATLLAATAGVSEAHEVHVDARNIFNGNELYVAEIPGVSPSQE